MFVPDRPSLPVDSKSLDNPGNALVAFSSPDISDEMSSWGTLINPDKSPAPLLEQLCLGIAQLMPTFDSNGTNDLTPDRIASFYRKVGGNYDPLFLGTKSTALSFIYQSLGCFHSLQPSNNPYEPPSVPSLLPAGFVRWQTIQLLMEPDEHWQYLQNAVSMWDITDANGELFPKDIPRDAFPSEPDPEMLQWHEGVSRRLELDYMKRKTQRASPPDFGGYHYRFSGKDPLPDEEEYVSHPPRQSAQRHHSYYEPDRAGRRRQHHRRLSAEYPAFNTHRPEPSFSRQDGGRSGVSSPRCPSPSSREYSHYHTRDHEQPTWHAHHPFPPEMGEPPEPENVSDDTIHEEEPEPEPEPQPRRRARHNLSPPHSRTRRHSHDAYSRKPFRDLSPSAPRRSHRGYDYEIPVPIPKTRKSNSDGTPRLHNHDDRSRSRSSGVKFKEFVFDVPHPGPAPAPAPAPVPDPAMYMPPPPRPSPRHRYNIDTYAEDVRRGSYSGGSTGGSRPGSGGSGSERPRSYSSAGFPPRTSRWTSPSRGPAKRYIPTSLAEDAEYISSRRPPVYK
ncbi:uncharacterized protein N7484_011937 [Penicillium longicatenatum]|uniref:uncharacterized protein n=1 Tax=Penicillium longicatenatum TaxID=1561947 RepID=UPI002548E4AF|nr:uncharacterized protein N7484_011937 [Penicillium longicatenatum]KAJ5631837.1 hypothetical protein N7484_011937 [Penicillium longicatenatum]